MKMNKGLIFGLGIFFGGGAGVAITAKVLKDKYEEKLEREIAEVRNRLLEQAAKNRQKASEQENPEPEAKKEAAVEAVKTYAAPDQKEEAAKVVQTEKPKIISPGVYDQAANPNQRASILYFTDGTLVRLPDLKRVLREDEIEEFIGGREVLDHFGDPDTEETRICVRNNELSTDFEVVSIACSRKEYLRGKNV